jgi:hypothetical protein
MRPRLLAGPRECRHSLCLTGPIYQIVDSSWGPSNSARTCAVQWRNHCMRGRRSAGVTPAGSENTEKMDLKHAKQIVGEVTVRTRNVWVCGPPSTADWAAHGINFWGIDGNRGGFARSRSKSWEIRPPRFRRDPSAGDSTTEAARFWHVSPKVSPPVTSIFQSPRRSLPLIFQRPSTSHRRNFVLGQNETTFLIEGVSKSRMARDPRGSAMQSAASAHRPVPCEPENLLGNSPSVAPTFGEASAVQSRLESHASFAG